ncbi:MAG: hypothetical protein EXS30_01000 [Pedosphaera sp.]|nr:hypothetical protein [Pedosphaera sp.]
MKPKLKENPREWQKFTAVVGAAIFLAGFVLQKRGVLPGRPLAVLVVTAIPVVVCLIRPMWFRGFYRAGTTAGFHVGQVVGKILLIVLFLVVLTPMGWLLRFAGKDLLNRKRKPDARSYWRPSKNASHFDRQF